MLKKLSDSINGEAMNRLSGIEEARYSKEAHTATVTDRRSSGKGITM